jgi:hypothetical protein
MTEQRTKDTLSSTPRTDAEAYPATSYGVLHVVSAGFARQLERELNEALKDAARYRWLKEQRRWLYNKPPTPGISIRWENYIAGDANWLDDAIDGAIEKQS